METTNAQHQLLRIHHQRTSLLPAWVAGEAIALSGAVARIRLPFSRLYGVRSHIRNLECAEVVIGGAQRRPGREVDELSESFYLKEAFLAIPLVLFGLYHVSPVAVGADGVMSWGVVDDFLYLERIPCGWRLFVAVGYAHHQYDDGAV